MPTVGDDVTLFEKREKYDRAYGGRAPSALVERIKAIAAQEDESENQTRAKLWLLGAQAYEWMTENRAFLEAFKKENDLHTHEALPKLLDLARQSTKAKR